MRLFFMIIAIISLTACNQKRSGNRPVVKENQNDTVSTENVDTDKQEPENLGDQIFSFWAKKIEVKPMVIDQNGTYGEGENPAITLEYEIYFISSVEEGKEEKFSAWAYIPTNKIVMEEPWYKDAVEEFNKLKELYNRITNAPTGRLYVEGDKRKIERISLKIDVEEKKVGNATIRQDNMVVLWEKEK